MRTVTVSWDKAEEQFVALGTHPGRSIVINAPHERGKTSEPTGFSATELLLAGAGACAAWDVIEILRKRRTQISLLDVSIEGHQEPEPPWTYRRVALRFRIAGDNLTLPVIARVIRLSVVRYCSVITTLAGAAAIEATVELLATDGTTTGPQPIELAIPAMSATGMTGVDIREDGAPEPEADES